MKFATCFSAVVLLPVIAWGHAFLDHADPRVGSEVSTAPTEVRIWFTQEIEPAFSVIQVFDSNGHEVDARDSHQDAKDKTLLIVSVPHLEPGVYRVAWRVVSVDTHHTQGDFKFSLK